MKTLIALLMMAATSASAVANNSSTLFVKDRNKLIDVETLIKNEVEVQTHYGLGNFCYSGNATAVNAKIRKWYKTGYFFSGGGGGFELQGLKINRGIATYDIVMTLEDEVVPGELRNVIVKPCR